MEFYFYVAFCTKQVTLSQVSPVSVERQYYRFLYLQDPVNSGYLLYVAWTPALDNGRRGATTKTQAGVIYSIDSPIAKAFSLRRASTEVAYICLEVLKSLIEMPGLDTVWTLPGYGLVDSP